MDWSVSYRPFGSVLSAAVSVVVALVVAADLLIRDGRDGLVPAGLAVLVGWGMWIGLGASSFRADAGGLRVRNGAKTWRIPWPCVADLSVSYQLRVGLTDGRTIVPWAGPERRRARPLADRRGPATPTGSALIAELQRIAGSGVREDGEVVETWSSWMFLPAVAGLFAVLAGILLPG